MRLLRRALRVVIALFILLNIMAIFHAYKFTYFYDDTTATVKKPEQMNGWEKTKVILFGLEYPKSVNTIRPNIRFDTLSLITADKMRLSGWYMPRDSAKGTVILFHGHGSSSGKILAEAYYMHSIGFNTLLIDFRAHGNSEGNVSTIGYREANDVKAAYDHVRAKGEKNIVLWGVSLGAATIAHAIAEYEVKPEKVILELSYGSLSAAAKGRIRTMGLPEQPIAGLLTFWGGTVRGFWAFGLSPEKFAKKISCPVLVQHGAKDARVTKAETEAIFRNIPHNNKKLVVYETAKHESLCAREPEKWKREIRAFLINN
jgi:alpha-beta hydrolase superfamily lysophospholipase